MVSKAWSSDEEAVRKAIEEDRQSVSKAREAWEKASGKKAKYIIFIVQTGL